MLRDYQVDLLERALSSKAADVCVQAPTGTGKTTIMAALARYYSGKRILFLAHRQEILRQIKDRLATFNIDSGIKAPWAERTDHDVQVASVQTLSRRDAEYYDVLITDESHHATASNYRKIYQSIDYDNHYGFTATPIRLDGRGLGEVYGDLIVAPPPHWFIKEGYLAQYSYFAPTKPVDTSGLHVRAGDFRIEEAAAMFSTGTVYGSIIDDWGRHAEGKRTIGFACTVNHARSLAERFNAEGIQSEVLCGAMGTPERQAVLGRLKAGDTKVIWTVDVVSEGFDLPECEAIIQARPTLSLSVYLQQVGRVLRPKPDGSKAIILDHAMNIGVHGFPCIEREWSLTGTKRSERKPIKRTCKVCPSCGYVSPVQEANCDNCGNEFYNPRTVREIGATMASVSPDESAQHHGQSNNEYEEYIKLLNTAAKKGYASGWAYHKAVERGHKTLPYKQAQGLYEKFRKQYGY